jgi:hypothetical protein
MLSAVFTEELLAAMESKNNAGPGVYLCDYSRATTSYSKTTALDLDLDWRGG